MAPTCRAAPSTWTVSPGGPERSWLPSCSVGTSRTGPSSMSLLAPTSSGGSAGRSPRWPSRRPEPVAPRPDDRARDQHPELFQTDPLAEQLVGLRELSQADLATAVEGMPPRRRSQIAAALEDGELADLLEEMPEQDQVRLLAGLGLERSADVVEEMQPDDAVDLLAEMLAEQRDRLLTAMESVQAADLRRLLSYDGTTAVGLTTSRPLSLHRTRRSLRYWPASGTRTCPSPRRRRCTCANRLW